MLGRSTIEAEAIYILKRWMEKYRKNRRDFIYAILLTYKKLMI